MGSYAEDDFPANEIECPNCGERVYIDVLACPKCGLRFYVDEVTEGITDEEPSQQKGIAVSAIIAGWLASATVAFLINRFASGTWNTSSLGFAGQAVVFAAGPFGALAGGYLSARVAGRRVILHGFVVAVLSLVTAILLETYWYDLFNAPLRPTSVASWIVLLLAGPAGAWLWKRFVLAAENPTRPQPREQRLYLDLLAKVRHDIDTAERLIDYERRRNPSSNRAVWIQYAIERIDHDRH